MSAERRSENPRGMRIPGSTLLGGIGLVPFWERYDVGISSPENLTDPLRRRSLGFELAVP
jgi:hypothetical protein